MSMFGTFEACLCRGSCDPATPLAEVTYHPLEKLAQENTTLLRQAIYYPTERSLFLLDIN